MHAHGPSSGPRCPGPDPLAPHSASLPFLPTLVTALAIGGLALLCRQPATPDAPAINPPGIATRMVENGDAPAEPAAALPGVAAFGQQYPLSVAGLTWAGPAKTPRIAAPPRRRCTGGACEPVRTAAPARSPDPVATSSLPASGQAEEQESPLPFDALPFVPTSEAMLDTVRSLGSRAVGLGSSVAGTLTLLR